MFVLHPPLASHRLLLPVFEAAGFLIMPMHNLTQTGCTQDAVGHCTPGKCCLRLNQYTMNVLHAALQGSQPSAEVNDASPSSLVEAVSPSVAFNRAASSAAQSRCSLYRF